MSVCIHRDGVNYSKNGLFYHWACAGSQTDSLFYTDDKEKHPVQDLLRRCTRIPVQSSELSEKDLIPHDCFVMGITMYEKFRVALYPQPPRNLHRSAYFLSWVFANLSCGKKRTNKPSKLPTIVRGFDKASHLSNAPLPQPSDISSNYHL